MSPDKGKINRAFAKEVAKAAKMADTGAIRLLGSLYLQIPASPSGPASGRYNVGMRLVEKDLNQLISGDRAVRALALALEEYRNSAPLVVNWVIRGDFDPTKIPKNITKANLSHASRTAGRLRSQVIRELL